MQWARTALFASALALSAIAPVSQAQTVERGLIKVGDATIEYVSRGKGEPIVLLPGGTLTVSYLDGVADSLAKSGYRVIGINFRRSGKSTGPAKGVTLQTFANDVAGVIEHLKIAPVHIAGNDFGNRVARMFAASHPQLVRSVILLAAGGKVALKPEAERALMIMFNPKSTDSEVLAIMPYFVSNPADSARIWGLMKAARAPEAAPIERAAAESTPLNVWWAPPGTTKYLILQGADDQIAPPENGEILKKELGDRATLVNVPKAAHLMPLEQPDTAASHIVAFIRKLGTKP